jgi:uncharacterized protein (DUF1697 family)
MAQRMVALLRGINVGRAKRVSMAELATLMAGLGFTEVKTHLNSGNVVFSCTPRAAAGAAAKIRSAIADELAVECEVMTRTAAELRDVIEANPLADVATDPAKYLVGFLSAKPKPEAVRAVQAGDYGGDAIRIIDDHAYLWCSRGVNDSPVVKLAWKRELGVSATTRNWRTVLKLAELAG